jgi:hypothetical protein
MGRLSKLGILWISHGESESDLFAPIVKDLSKI